MLVTSQLLGYLLPFVPNLLRVSKFYCLLFFHMKCILSFKLVSSFLSTHVFGIWRVEENREGSRVVKGCSQQEAGGLSCILKT